MSAVRDQVKARVDELIVLHCEQHEQYRHERYRVTMAELSGQPDPKVIASVEESLTKVYGLLYESSERLARISAQLEFNEGNINDG